MFSVWGVLVRVHVSVCMFGDHMNKDDVKLKGTDSITRNPQSSAFPIRVLSWPFGERDLHKDSGTQIRARHSVKRGRRVTMFPSCLFDSCFNNFMFVCVLFLLNLVVHLGFWVKIVKLQRLKQSWLRDEERKVLFKVKLEDMVDASTDFTSRVARGLIRSEVVSTGRSFCLTFFILRSAYFKELRTWSDWASQFVLRLNYKHRFPLVDDFTKIKSQHSARTSKKSRCY